MNSTSFAALSAQSLKRSDFEVLKRTVGVSSTLDILLGVVQVIDGKYYRVLGLRLDTERYSYSQPPTLDFWPFNTGTTADRAYFEALAKVPNADNVLDRSYTVEKSGFWPLWTKETVAFVGKAVRLKLDTELGNN